MTFTRNCYNAIKCFSTSSVSVGRMYELLSIDVLKNYCFELIHRGSVGDKGIDFSGRWVLPSNIVPIIGQCKLSKKTLLPSVVRELEGVLSHHEDHLGILVASKGFSAAAVEAFNWSSCPMMLCHIVSLKRKHPAIWKKLFEPETEISESRTSNKPIITNTDFSNNGLLVSCLLNSKAQKIMPGVSVAKRHILGKYKHKMIVEILYTSVDYRKNTHNVRTIRIRQY